MKIGFVLECTPGGPEEQICRWIAQTVSNGVFESVVRPMGNKRALMEECVTTVRALLDDGCRHVFVIWDLRPAWPDHSPLDCVAECTLVRSQLATAAVGDHSTCVCIIKELEVWLLADLEAVREICGSKAHRAERISSLGKLEYIDNPKDRLDEIITQRRGRKRRYNAHTDALKIMRRADWNKLRDVPSFKRFADKLTKLLPSGRK